MFCFHYYTVANHGQKWSFISQPNTTKNGLVYIFTQLTGRLVWKQQGLLDSFKHILCLDTISIPSLQSNKFESTKRFRAASPGIVQVKLNAKLSRVGLGLDLELLM